MLLKAALQPDESSLQLCRRKCVGCLKRLFFRVAAPIRRASIDAKRAPSPSGRSRRRWWSQERQDERARSAVQCASEQEETLAALRLARIDYVLVRPFGDDRVFACLTASLATLQARAVADRPCCRSARAPPPPFPPPPKPPPLPTLIYIPPATRTHLRRTPRTSSCMRGYGASPRAESASCMRVPTACRACPSSRSATLRTSASSDRASGASGAPTRTRTRGRPAPHAHEHVHRTCTAPAPHLHRTCIAPALHLLQPYAPRTRSTDASCSSICSRRAACAARGSTWRRLSSTASSRTSSCCTTRASRRGYPPQLTALPPRPNALCQPGPSHAPHPPLP